MKVIVAFLLPLMVFITVLAGADRVLAGWMASGRLRTIVVLFTALAASVVFILIVRIVIRLFAGKGNCIVL